MFKYIAQRLIALIPVLFIISVVVFMFIHLIPGDAVDYILGVESTPEARVALRAELGLDRNIVVQYLSWGKKIIVGDFGKSVINQKPVLGIILEKFPATILLAFSAILIAVLIAITAGTIAAANRESWKDLSVLLFSLVGVSIPSFCLGILLILFFSIQFPIFPSIGYESPLVDFWKSMHFLCLPAITLGAVLAGSITRMTRSEMVEQLSKDYITTASAKGMSRAVVVYKHALRNSLLTVVTFTGLELGSLLGGTVVVESIFAWPGIGRLVINSIFSRDYPMVQGIVLFMAFNFVLLNLLVDISYTFLNPQIRLERKGG
jgi:ABC-type dipeptide/oligopeptide/nickel transport system permease component